MRKHSLIAILILGLLASCESTKESSYDFEGSWKAEWETNPEAFEGVGADLEYVMTGEFKFDGDQLTVIANGYPDCIFGEDTLEHTQKWELKGDTLFLISEPDIYGISYLVSQLDENRLELNLVQDIKVTLTR